MVAWGHKHPEVEIIIPVLPRSLKVKGINCLTVSRFYVVSLSKTVGSLITMSLLVPPRQWPLCGYSQESTLYIHCAQPAAPSDTGCHSLSWKYGFQRPCSMVFFLLLQPFLSSELRWCPCIPLTLHPRVECWAYFPVYLQALRGDLNQPHGNC